MACGALGLNGSGGSFDVQGVRNTSRVFALAPLALTHLSWVGLCAVGALALVQLVVSEWQRRRTLLDLIKHAPLGTVVEQDTGMGGAKMRVKIGTGKRPYRWRA